MAPRPLRYYSREMLNEPGEPNHGDWVPLNHWSLAIGNPLELVVELTATEDDINSSRSTKPDPEAFRKEGWKPFRSFQNAHTDYTDKEIEDIAKRISKIYNKYNRYGDNCQIFVDRLWWLISQKTETHDIWKLVGMEPVGTQADRLKLYRDYGFIMDQGATVADHFDKHGKGGGKELPVVEEYLSSRGLPKFDKLMISGIPETH